MNPNPEEVFKSDGKFYQVKTTALMENDQNSTMIQIIDVSNSVQCDEVKKHNELLNLINATVSHELRNPLNSICAQSL
jgi:signal transduction histidine kinase